MIMPAWSLLFVGSANAKGATFSLYRQNKRLHHNGIALTHDYRNVRFLALHTATGWLQWGVVSKQ